MSDSYWQFVEQLPNKKYRYLCTRCNTTYDRSTRIGGRVSADSKQCAACSRKETKHNLNRFFVKPSVDFESRKILRKEYE